MTSRKLGRGLEALLPAGGAGAVDGLLSPGGDAEGTLRRIPVDLISRGRYQPRVAMDEAALAELAESIRARGVMQPILVRPLPEGGRFEIIAGERRWRACALAGLDAVPALVRRVDDSEAMALALIENIQREDLNPIEEAMALTRLRDEFGLTHQGVADAVGRSRPAVSNMMRLTALPAAARRLVEEGALEMGHARALLALPEGRQAAAAAEAARRGLSVRQTEALVRRWTEAEKGEEPRRPEEGGPDIRRLEESLARTLGAKVEIRHAASGRGRLTVSYGSLDELDGILERIRSGG